MSLPQPTLRTLTLGCKVNQYETEYARQALLAAGYRESLPNEPASLCLINTCTVTAEGDAKGRQAIRRLARENPDARIAVMGCYVARAPDEVAGLPGVSDLLTDKRELPDWLRRFGVMHPPTGLTQMGQRKRAYIKVQDGCLLRCSYCIIPVVRPHFESRPLDAIVEEVSTQLQAGRKEVILTGIHLGHYGVEWNAGKPKASWIRLATLLERLAQLPGRFRIRLSSIEATEVTRELLQVMADHADKVCPHLHVCLQSGSDRILRRMKRRWGVKHILDRCELAALTLDLPAFSTDVIVGFPGEQEEDFAATVSALRAMGCFRIHAFPFSKRAGTPAAYMTEMPRGEEVAERMARLESLQTNLRDAYFAQLTGKRLQVMVESSEEHPRDPAGPRMLAGSACRYVPVQLEGTTALGDFAEVIAMPAAPGAEYLPGRAV